MALLEHPTAGSVSARSWLGEVEQRASVAERTRRDLDLAGYLAVLRRRWWVIAAMLVLGVALALASVLLRTPVFEAESRVLLAPTAAQEAASGSENPFALTREVANELTLAQGDATIEGWAARIGVSDLADLPDGDVIADDRTDVLTFVVRSESAADAAIAADAWADAYIEAHEDRSTRSIVGALAGLEADLADLRVERDELRAPLVALEAERADALTDEGRARIDAEIRAAEAVIAADLRVLDARIGRVVERLADTEFNGDLALVGAVQPLQRAVEPLAPLGSSLPTTLVGAAAIALVLGIAAAMAVDNLDQRIVTLDDIEQLGIQVLGAVPAAPKKGDVGELGTITLRSPDHPIADAYQSIRTALQFVAVGGGVETILVTSPSEGDGKSTTALNVAASLAQVGRRVVLADADLRRPRIHDLLDSPQEPGLTDLFLARRPVDEIALSGDLLPDRLLAIPAGTRPPNPASFLSSQGFEALVEGLRSAADIVVFDAPPILPVADAKAVAPLVDGVVLCVRAGRTSRPELVGAVDAVEASGGRLLGVLLVGAKASAIGYGPSYAA